MIQVNAVLMEAEVEQNGIVVTEGACEEIVRRFKEKTEPVFAKLGNSPVAVGKLIDVSYRKTDKKLMGVIELNIDFSAGGRILQRLKTPAVDRIVDSDIKAVFVNINPIKSVNKEDKNDN